MTQLEQNVELASRFRIVAPLGRGGMATVYRAHDALLEADVALKVLEDMSAERRILFHHEFARLAGCRHPNLARCRDFGHAQLEGDGVDFYTADLIDGVPLDIFAADRVWREICQALRGPLEALAWLHRAGLAHGDFKPGNIIVDHAGVGVLIDLSAAWSLRRDVAAQGRFRGTVGFVAPERLSLRTRPDARADVYSVGKTLLALDLELPADVEALAARCADDDPGARPSDVEEILEALGVGHIAEVHPMGEPAQLIGRGEESRLLSQAISALLAARRGPRVLAIDGGAGVGKSRLFRHALWDAQLRCAAAGGHVIEGGAPRAVTGARDAGARHGAFRRQSRRAVQRRRSAL